MEHQSILLQTIVLQVGLGGFGCLEGKNYALPSRIFYVPMLAGSEILESAIDHPTDSAEKVSATSSATTVATSLPSGLG